MADELRVNNMRVAPEYYRGDSDQNIQKAFVNPMAVPQDISIGQPPVQPAPVKSTDAVDESQPVKFASIKALLKKVWTLFAPDAAKDDNQVTEARKIDQSLQAIGSRPVLPAPKPGSASGMEELMALLKKAEDEQLVPKVSDDDESIESEQPGPRLSFSDLDESALDKATYDIHRSQVQIREKSSVNISESIIHDGEEKKRLWKQYLDLKEEAQRKAKQSKILGWLGIGTGIIGGALFIGSIIAAIFTGGLAALPVALAVAGGVAAMSQGGTQIGGSVLGHQSNLRNGESFVAKEQMTLKKDDIMMKLQNLQENDNSITQLWSNLAQMLRNTPSDLFR